MSLCAERIVIGNEGPEASVEALLDISGDAPSVDDSRVRFNFYRG